MLSQEVLNILCNELDVRPVRDDVSYPDYFRPASDIKTVDLDQEYVNQHKTEIVDKFTEVYQGTFYIFLFGKPPAVSGRRLAASRKAREV